MITRSLSSAQFVEITRPLLGRTISWTWRGHGSAIFFEIGELTQYESQRKNGEVRVHSVGEITLMIEWSWRVENLRSIDFGSFNTKRQIESGIQKLQNSTIESIELEGRIPEVVVGLSCGRWVHSFATVESQPQWSLLWTHPLNPRERQHWIRCERGKVVLVENLAQPISTSIASASNPPFAVTFPSIFHSPSGASGHRASKRSAQPESKRSERN